MVLIEGLRCFKRVLDGDDGDDGGDNNDKGIKGRRIGGFMKPMSRRIQLSLSP